MNIGRRTRAISALSEKRKPSSSGKSDNPQNVPSPQNVGGDTREQIVAKLMFASTFANANTARAYVKEGFRELDIAASLEAMTEQVVAVRRGDLGGVEATLAAQAVTLDMIFGELARRAVPNFGARLGAGEIYLRLALKAQAQCRATLETLAEIKNPRPLAFVKQANIAQGPQQVNNRAGEEPARARENENGHSKLLDPKQGERLDAGAAAAGRARDPSLEAMALVDRPKDA